MKCEKCMKDKLSNEFPPETIHESCEHPSLICLQCILFESDNICPAENCNNEYDKERLEWFHAIWNKMFKEYNPTDVSVFEVKSDEASVLHVTVLNGESAQIAFDKTWTITKLKTEIKKEIGLDVNEQRLLYSGQELTTKASDTRLATLADFSIKPNSTIQLVKLLYAIPQDLKQVVFDLNWEYPKDTDLLEGKEKRDYLDATCFIFEKDKCVRTIDFVQKNALMMTLMNKYKNKGIKTKNWGVVHSGDKMDDKNRVGHHIIDVSIGEIPNEVTNLFFVLSAWNSPTISRYPNPSLNFYEKSTPDVDLCSTTFSHASVSQAVVMCSLSRTKSGWVVYENGKTSAGNAKDYATLKCTIQELIAEGY